MSAASSNIVRDLKELRCELGTPGLRDLHSFSGTAKAVPSA